MTKRKRKSSKSPSSVAHSDDAMPSFRSFEKIFAGFGDGVPSDAPLDRAQELIYQAWDIPNPAKRIALAKQALSICADCADAYMLQAEELPHTLEQQMELYEQAVAAGERALGADTFKDSVGHFWGLHETRPYMRARLQLALTLYDFGDRMLAIDHLQDMLRLNPNDNQGLRDILLGWLLRTDQLAEAQALWTQYADDATACWSWSRALMAYMERRTEAAAYLDHAIADNAHIAPLLLGRESLPEDPSEYVGIGDFNEAAAYVLGNLGLWQQTEGALRWLSRAVPINSGK